MTEFTAPVLPDVHLDSLYGEVLAENVAYEDFLDGFKGLHVEWVNGTVIQMAGIEREHDIITTFLIVLFEMLLPRIGTGVVLHDPMLMKLPAVPSSRAPDLQVLLPAHLDRLQGKQVLGAADLVIEVVFEGSRRTDTITKVLEYEKGGVPEYWILDWKYKAAHFNVLGNNRLYSERDPDANGIYHSPTIPQLALPVHELWQPALRRGPDALRLVEAMMAK